MGDKMRLIRLPILLVVIAFLGKLIGGFAGMPYEAGVQVFGMVPLALHLAIVWGALGRTIYGLKLGQAAMLGLLICVIAEVLIFGATFFSYAAGLDTHFNNPLAVARVTQEVPFGEAMLSRTIGILVGAVLGCIGASIGYALGGFVAAGRASS